MGRERVEPLHCLRRMIASGGLAPRFFVRDRRVPHERMKHPRSLVEVCSPARFAAGLLCAGLVAGAAANPGGFQHPPLGGAAGPAGSPGAPGSPARTVAPPRDPAAKPVDVNNASRAELMKLPGIGAAEADRIVQGRPYLSKASLVSQRVLPATTYDSLRGRLFVGPVKGQAAAKAAKVAHAANPAKAASKP